MCKSDKMDEPSVDEPSHYGHNKLSTKLSMKLKSPNSIWVIKYVIILCLIQICMDRQVLIIFITQLLKQLKQQHS